MLLASLFAAGQTATQNYITTNSMLGNGDTIKTTVYYDGLGKPTETIWHDFSPLKSDNVAMIEYDLQNRVSKEWLPAVMNAHGAFQSTESVQSASRSSNNDVCPYVSKFYESNPLSRETAIYGAGDNWYANSKSLNYVYLTNSGIGGDLTCKRYRVSDGGDSFSQDGFYAEGELDVVKTIDEDGHIKYDFKNLYGDIVLQRTVGNENHDTYYLYDYRGNLCFVLSPKASSQLGNATNIGVDNNSIVANLSFFYKYDSKNRCIEKKLPGCEPVYYVYDMYHLPIFSQDGNQRAKGQWAFTAYDRLGRVAYSGVTSESRTAAQLRNAYKDLAPRVDFNSQNELGYPILYQNVTAGDILLMNYYDYYDFLDKFAFCDSLQYRTMNGYDEKYVNASYPQHSAKGLLTGTMARTLDGVGTSLVKSVYYDHHGNVIQSHERNHRGGYDHNYMHLTFTGKPLTVLHQHSTDSCTVSDLYSYTYDHMERLLTTSLSHDGAAAVTLSSNTYDELGRLDSCAMNNGGHGATVAYTYNVRGWVQSVVNNHFYEWLHYQDAPSGGTPCYNGNISGITWLQRESLKAATSAESQYSFSYDGLNRLSRADYCCESDEWNGNLLSLDTRDFSCSYSYDLNGNMTKLQRKGVNYYNTSLPTHMYKHDTIDNLQLTYNGNQLTKVEDQCVDLTYAGAMDFKDGATKATEYTYDANGNMTSDRNKGISSITYNMLNLPQTVLFDDGHETCYTYAADGRKLRVEYRLNNFSIVETEKAKASDGYDAIASPSALDENGIIETPAEPISRTLMTRDYCGNYIYKNGCLERVMTENGYMQDGELYFYIKDYQGNVRVVLNQANQPVEVNSYYPYGGLMAATTTEGAQPYKYGTKELDRENGLDWYDSKARMYDPTIGRTPTLDPMAEKYYSMSPYLWCAANPITFTDPTGKEILLSGTSANVALQQIQKSVGSEILLSLTNNTLSYLIVKEGKLSKNAKRIISMIDDGNITVDILATDSDRTTTGNLFVGGAFMGNYVELDENGNVVKTTAFQEINPTILGKMDGFSDEGASIMHEITEAYEGAKISAEKKKSSPNAKSPNSVYKKAHNKATFQPKVYQRMLDCEGDEVQDIKKAIKVEWYIRQNVEPYEERKIQTYP